jgi:hypothetical protein
MLFRPFELSREGSNQIWYWGGGGGGWGGCAHRNMVMAEVAIVDEGR